MAGGIRDGLRECLEMGAHQRIWGEGRGDLAKACHDKIA